MHDWVSWFIYVQVNIAWDYFISIVLFLKIGWMSPLFVSSGNVYVLRTAYLHLQRPYIRVWNSCLIVFMQIWLVDIFLWTMSIRHILAAFPEIACISMARCPSKRCKKETSNLQIHPSNRYMFNIYAYLKFRIHSHVSAAVLDNIHLIPPDIQYW